MNRIATLYTCHNRKVKTLASLKSLYQAFNNNSQKNISIEVYLTDDGSTDGTAEAIALEFPLVNITKGDGQLFWAKGMRKSWELAKQKNYDFYLLLNDDVELYEDFLENLLETHIYCTESLNKGGIYLGATENKFEKKLTYSGSLVTNKFLYRRKRLAPNGNFQSCDLGNANIMMVSKNVVDKIGVISKDYSHGMADYDYTLTAKKNNLPVLIAPKYCGHCVNDHKDKYENFEKKSFEERRKILYHPTGLALNSYLIYMKKFFPFRYPFVAFFGWFKLYFPNLYITYFRK